MEKTLTAVCEYLNNWFWRSQIEGRFTIENGSIEIPSLKEGQYFRIIGSTFNEGVHIYGVDDLTDEEFTGSVWSMVVPQAIIDLTHDIDDWVEKYGDVNSPAMSPYNYESFGNYSYSKGESSGNGSGKANTWENVFANRLIPYRRLRGAR